MIVARVCLILQAALAAFASLLVRAAFPESTFWAPFASIAPSASFVASRRLGREALVVFSGWISWGPCLVECGSNVSVVGSCLMTCLMHKVRHFLSVTKIAEYSCDSCPRLK